MTCSRSHRIATRLQQLAAAFFLVGILPAIFSNAAQANFMIPVTRVECLPEFGIVTISEGTIRGKRAARSFEDHPDEIAAKYGYYELSSYFIIEGEDEDPPNPRIVGSRTKSIECQLADHKVEITFEPSIAKPCSAAVTIILSIRVNGTIVVDDLSFYKTCLRQDSVSSFRFEEDGEFVMIQASADKTRNPDETGDSFSFSVVYQLDELGSQPIRTFEDLFSAYEHNNR